MVFWRKKQAQPPNISCFGKLRATGDFIRLNASSSENAAFDRWIGGGMNLAKQTLGDGFDNVYQPTMGLFLYRGDDSSGEPERGMVGVWGASGDSAGRRYPMVVSASYDFEQMLALGPSMPIVVWPLLQAAYDLVSNGRGLSVEEFLSRVAQLKPPPIADPDAAMAPYRGWLGQQTMRSLWESGFGSIDVRHPVMYSINASVEIFAGQQRPQTGLAIRLPLGAGDAYAACVWTEVALRLSKCERTVINMFWTPQHELIVHIGQPHVATFRELLAPTSSAEHITDLTQPPTMDVDQAKQALPRPVASVVEDTEMSIAAFLQRL
jgi:type VI secretion system protein ImpM